MTTTTSCKRRGGKKQKADWPPLPATKSSDTVRTRTHTHTVPQGDHFTNCEDDFNLSLRCRTRTSICGRRGEAKHRLRFTIVHVNEFTTPLDFRVYHFEFPTNDVPP